MLTEKSIQEFLQCVAYGQYEEVASLLAPDSQYAQILLTSKDIPFTDYSMRTFTCTGYQYSLWSKNYWMCELLERFMDDTTAKIILELVLSSQKLTGITVFQSPKGLTYTQNGKEDSSMYFDLNLLKTALINFSNDNTKISEETTRSYSQSHGLAPYRERTNADFELLKKRILNIGLAQKQLPVTYSQLYCNITEDFCEISKSSALLDKYNASTMRRPLTIVKYIGNQRTETFWYDDPGLGYSFAILSGTWGMKIFWSDSTMINSNEALFAKIDYDALEIIENKLMQRLKLCISKLDRSKSLNSEADCSI